jgi:hypothetical protein
VTRFCRFGKRWSQEIIWCDQVLPFRQEVVTGSGLGHYLLVSLPLRGSRAGNAGDVSGEHQPITLMSEV